MRCCFLRIWPDDLIFALPMILFVDRNMDMDRDINVAPVGLEFQNPIQYDHSCLGPMISTLGGFCPARNRAPVAASPCDGLLAGSQIICNRVTILT